MELLHARRDNENDAASTAAGQKPIDRFSDPWMATTQVAAIGVFLLLLVAGLYVSRPVVFPVLAAMVVGTTFAPLVKYASSRGISSWATAFALIALLLAAIGAAATMIAAPMAESIGRAPEVGELIKTKLYVLDRPLSALRELQEVLQPTSGNSVSVQTSQIGFVTPVVAFVTPAVAEIGLFLVTLLFFLANQIEFRRHAASTLSGRNARLTFLRIVSDVENNLASYLATVTGINFCLGVVVAVGAWLYGFPNPLIIGILAMVLNYLPYIGPAAMAIILFGVGLVTFPTLGSAFLAPALFVALATAEGQFITPTILGRRLTLNPFLVILALAFWSWLWGPLGAFLAVPLSIVGLVTINHLFPDDAKLPG